MKKLRLALLATASSIALIGTATAADLPTKAPVPVLATSWAGPYAGVSLGAALNHSSFTDVDQFFFLLPGGPNNNFWSNTRAGITGGGLLGYNLQSGKIVYGIEGDLNWAGSTSSANLPNSVSVATSKLEWISTFRGRLGFTVDPATLLYATGGVAVARFSDFWGAPQFGSRFTFPSNFTRTGWTLGGGVERMFAPHWTGRVEALYADFGTQTTTIVDPAGTYRTRFEHSVTQVRGALAYKW
jgi:outer membrane immunogenic protein